MKQSPVVRRHTKSRQVGSPQFRQRQDYRRYPPPWPWLTMPPSTRSTNASTQPGINLLMFSAKGSDHYSLLGRIPGSFRAKTGILVPELNRIICRPASRDKEPKFASMKFAIDCAHDGDECDGVTSARHPSVRLPQRCCQVPELRNRRRGDSKNAGLTKYVGTFVTQTKYQEIPADVIELGKKSILDGLGLALAGSRAESGSISRRYVSKRA